MAVMRTRKRISDTVRNHAREAAEQHGIDVSALESAAETMRTLQLLEEASTPRTVVRKRRSVRPTV